jgi:hypothetical protein
MICSTYRIRIFQITKHEVMNTDTDLVHQNFDTGVHTRSNCIIQRTFKALLLLYRSVQEIRFIDVFSLFSYWLRIRLHCLNNHYSPDLYRNKLARLT